MEDGSSPPGTSARAQTRRGRRQGARGGGGGEAGLRGATARIGPSAAALARAGGGDPGCGRGRRRAQRTRVLSEKKEGRRE